MDKIIETQTRLLVNLKKEIMVHTARVLPPGTVLGTESGAAMMGRFHRRGSHTPLSVDNELQQKSSTRSRQPTPLRFRHKLIDTISG